MVGSQLACQSRVVMDCWQRHHLGRYFLGGLPGGHVQDDWRAEHLIVAAAVGLGIGAATALMWLWLPALETAQKSARQARPRDAAAGTGSGSASGSPGTNAIPVPGLQTSCLPNFENQGFASTFTVAVS